MGRGDSSRAAFRRCDPVLQSSPTRGCKSNKDYSPWNLETLPGVRSRGRTTSGRASATTRRGGPHWDGSARADRALSRVISSRMAEYRRAVAAGRPYSSWSDARPHVSHAGARRRSRTTVSAGLWSSLPLDFLFKVSGKETSRMTSFERFPVPRDHPLEPTCFLRTLRLNCLTARLRPSVGGAVRAPSFAIDAWTRRRSAARPHSATSLASWTHVDAAADATLVVARPSSSSTRSARWCSG